MGTIDNWTDFKKPSVFGRSYLYDWQRAVLAENVYPAILTKEEFETAQHKGKSKKHIEPHISAPLVGKVICAECGRSMVRSAHDSGGKEIVSFRCRTSTVLSESSCFRGAALETDI